MVYQKHEDINKSERGGPGGPPLISTSGRREEKTETIFQVSASFPQDSESFSRAS